MRILRWIRTRLIETIDWRIELARLRVGTF
jgi:hypothetical protein